MKSNWFVVLAVLLCLMVFSTVFADETNTDCCSNCYDNYNCCNSCNCCCSCSSVQYEKDQTDNCDAVSDTVDSEIPTHKVTYIGGGCLAAVPTDPHLYQAGEPVRVLFDPVTYTDYQIFYGWDGNGDGIADYGYDYNSFVMGDSDVTLCAICIPAWSSNAEPSKPDRRGWRPWQGKDWFYNSDPWGFNHDFYWGRGWGR